MKWIDVKQGLPSDGDPVLIVWCGVVQWLTYRLFEGNWYACHEDPDEAESIEGDIPVTHWMPLPEPPEAERVQL